MWSGDDYRTHVRAAIYGVLFGNHVRIGKNEMESQAFGNLHSLLSSVGASVSSLGEMGIRMGPICRGCCVDGQERG